MSYEPEPAPGLSELEASRADALEWAAIQAERAERVDQAARVLRRAQQYGGPLAQQAAALELERAARWSPWRSEHER